MEFVPAGPFIVGTAPVCGSAQTAGEVSACFALLSLPFWCLVRRLRRFFSRSPLRTSVNSLAKKQCLHMSYFTHLDYSFEDPEPPSLTASTTDP